MDFYHSNVHTYKNIYNNQNNTFGLNPYHESIVGHTRTFTNRSSI